MEQAYQRYVAMVQSTGASPVDFETFAQSGLLANFLDYERVSRSAEIDLSSSGFSAYRRSINLYGQGGETQQLRDKAIRKYISFSRGKFVRGLSPAKPRKPRAKKPRIPKAIRFTDAEFERARQRIPVSNLTPQQVIELNLAIQYRNMGQGLEAYIRSLGHNPLLWLNE